MKRLLLGLGLIALLAWLIITHASSGENKAAPLRFPSYPPALALETMALGNKELVSTLIFYNAQFYFGEKYAWRQEQPEYQRLFAGLDKATDLDPRNMDCYYFAQGLFSDIKPAVPVLNRLLKKGLESRPTDWYLPFFLSANYYFQLKDPVTASRYLQKAAALNPDNALFASLSARMLYQGNQTEAAVLYLRGFIKETNNPSVRKLLLKRLYALEAIHYLEQAVAVFGKQHSRPPSTLVELVHAGIIKKIPQDPYGGTFQFDATGRVVTTSKLAEAWKSNDSRDHNQQTQ
jgi:tetratricopeptide (TPR) repeat protein